MRAWDRPNWYRINYEELNDIYACMGQTLAESDNLNKMGCYLCVYGTNQKATSDLGVA